MGSKIIVPESVCEDDVIDYIASRYSMTPEQVIRHFMLQEGILKEEPEESIYFRENEMAILRDMGIKPSTIEFVKQ